MIAAAPKPFTKEDVEHRIDALPTLPSVIGEIMGVSPLSDDFLLKVRDLAQRDPPLAARIIAAANGANYAAVTPIISIPDALMRLGSMQVAHLILSLSVVRVFVPKTEGNRNLWRHALQVAVGARTIASHGRGIDPHLAYVGGLLHDIGRFVMFEHAPLEVDAVDDTGWTNPAELLEAEQKLCGFQHADVGARACEAWAIPKALSELVRLHHADALDAAIGQPLAAAIKAVQLADALSCLLLKNPEVVLMDPVARHDLIETIIPKTRPGAMPASAHDLSSFTVPIHEESANLMRAVGIPPLGPRTR